MEHGANLDGSFIKGFSRTTFEDDVYTTTNTIFRDGDIFTTFHEDTHGMRRAAIKDGRFTREEQVTAVRAINEGLRKVGGRNAPRLYFTDPATGQEVTDDALVTDTMLDEAISEIMESEVLRVSKLGGNAAKSMNTRAIGELSKALDAGAAASPIFAKAISKLRGMMRYLRAKYGEVFNRAVGTQAAIQRGDINEGEYHAFLDKLAGRDDVNTANEQAVETAREVIDGVERVTFEDGSEMDTPFSITRGDAVRIRNEIAKQIPLKIATDAIPELPTAKQALEWMESNNVFGVTTHPKIDGQIEVRPRGGKNTIGHRLSKKKAGVMLHLKSIIQQSTYMDKFQATTNMKSHRLAGSVEIDGEKFIARIVIDEDANGTRYYNHELSALASLEELTKSPQPLQSLVSSETEQQMGGQEFEDTGKLLQFIFSVNEENSDTAYSIKSRVQHADQLTALQQLAAQLATDPERKRAIMERAASNLAKQRRDVARTVRAFGKDMKTKVLSDERTRQNIQREANMRQALRREELEDAALAKHQGILVNEDLTKLREMPIHSVLSHPTNPLKGRLRSRAATAKMQGDMFENIQLSDYDGAGGLNKTIFGGTMAPDQMAQELYEMGLIRDESVDTMWDAIRKEQDSVAKMKELMRKAKAEMAQARVTARDEAKAWQKEELKRQKLDHSLHAKIVRAFGMLDKTKPRTRSAIFR